MPAIEVNEYIQVAHRLTLMPGKCQQIHGHSMRVFLKLYVEFGEHGYAVKPGTTDMIDYGDVKDVFRNHLKKHYDHRVLLNEQDPWAQPIGGWSPHDAEKTLPGLKTCPGDPTTENLCTWIAEWASTEFEMDAEVRIEETVSNAVACGV